MKPLLDRGGSGSLVRHWTIQWKKLGVCLACLLVGGSLLAPLAQAQRLGRMEETNSNSTGYHYFMQPGAASVQVRVLGTVRSPGLYELSDGTDLGTLLALSGGPTLGVLQQNRRRKVNLRLYRPYAETQHRLLYEATFSHALTEPEAYPLLQDGDVLTVEVTERRRFTWRDFFPLFGAVASIALALDRFSRSL